MSYKEYSSISHSRTNLNKKNLLIINYALDLENSIFAHQTEIVSRLASYFDYIQVITMKIGSFRLPSNVGITVIPWVPGNFFRNLMLFYRKTIPILFRYRRFPIFSHMTEVQSLLILPFTKFFHIKHYLWYAHAHKSIYLKLLDGFLDAIISSTSGSCPITRNRVYLIGQSIDEKTFVFRARKKYEFNKLVHVGRLDPSKNIEKLMQLVLRYRNLNDKASISFYGAPSSKNNYSYVENLKSKYSEEIRLGIINFYNPVIRERIPEVLSNYDIFVHSFQGSLDKVLIEATLTGIPLITNNLEYISQFEMWGDQTIDLFEQLLCLTKANHSEIKKKVNWNHDIAMKSHTLNIWIDNLVAILQDRPIAKENIR